MTDPQNPRLDHGGNDTHARSVEPGQTTPQASEPSLTNGLLPAGPQSAPSTNRASSSNVTPSAEPHSSTPAGLIAPSIGGLPVVDPLLFIHVTNLGDLEQLRIASDNRLRILTTDAPDDDGIMRGFGLDVSHPDVARLTGIAGALGSLEHDAELAMNRSLRRSAIYPWVKAQRGLGDRQVARLLGAVGDPYWHLAEDRPRTVSELWAYCGLHVLPAGPGPLDAQTNLASGAQPPADQDHRDAHSDPVGGTQTSDPGQSLTEPHLPCAGVAARRRKGQRANWSTEAKTRAWCVIESCMKQLDPDCKDPDSGIAKHVTGCTCSPYRITVDQRRTHTATTHLDWTPKHSQLDGMRIASKALLRDLWRESKRLHEVGPR